MLGKLFKYEWKGFRLPVLIILIVLIGTTTVACSIILSINPKNDEVNTAFAFLSLWFSLLLYYFGIICCSVGVMLTIAVRFYKTCYTDQGYLTHTLPVSTQKILNAKIISSIAVNMLTISVIAVSAFIIINVGINHIASIIMEEDRNIASIQEARREILGGISTFIGDFEDLFNINFGWYSVYLIFYLIIALISNTVIILGCVSLGQLYAKHRVIGIIISYFVVQFILNTFKKIISLLMFGRMLSDTFEGKNILMSPSMNLTLLFLVITAVAMYFINLHMMTTSLNLE